MDSLTHTAIGICTGHLIAGKKLGKKAMLYGAIANNFPDIDVIANLWASDTKALLIHRGITHSFLAIIFFSFLFAWSFQKIHNKVEMPFKKWLWLFASGLLLHLFTDSLTSYGTGWFEPFSNYRVSFNTIFILDPFFMLPVLICAIVMLFLKSNSPISFKWAKAGLVISSLYVLFTIVNKLYVNSVVKQNLETQSISYKDFMATPTPLNNFLWYIVARNSDDYRVGYYSLLDDDNAISFHRITKNDSLLNFPCDTTSVNDLVRFSQDYYCFSLKNDTIIFSDMRFGQMGGWADPAAGFVFNFKLATNCSNKDALQKGRFEAFNSETTIQLFRRIKGIKNK